MLRQVTRSGSASPLKGCEQFLAETMARLPEGLAIKAVRGDAGFFSKDFVSALEQRELGYLKSMVTLEKSFDAETVLLLSTDNELLRYLNSPR